MTLMWVPHPTRFSWGGNTNLRSQAKRLAVSYFFGLSSGAVSTSFPVTLFSAISIPR
jgi:hypothetical protein